MHVNIKAGRIGTQNVIEGSASAAPAPGAREALPAGQVEQAPRIFVSHSSTDLSLVTKLVQLLTAAIKLQRSEIRCTSVPGCRLPVGTDVNAILPAEVVGAAAFVCLITSEALHSTYVLFEAGARWGAGGRIFPLLAPGALAAQLPAPIAGRHAAATSSRTDMLQFVREIAQELGATVSGADTYEEALSAVLRHPGV